MNGPNDGSPESFSASGRCKVRCRETICVADSRFLCPFFCGYSDARVRTLIIAAAGIVNRVVDGYHKTSASFTFDVLFTHRTRIEGKKAFARTWEDV